VCLCGSVRSLQRSFPIDDILLRSGDIRDQVAEILKVLARQMSDRILQIWVTVEYVAKFGDDWRSDLRD